MTATYYQSVSPVGGKGAPCLTAQEARRDAVDRARRGFRGALALDEGQYGVLWRSLEQLGWRIEGVSPTGGATR